MASNFSDEPFGGRLTEPAPETPAGSPEPASNAPAPTFSPAVERFRACRWRRPPEDGVECCTHRDVLPMAGATSFNPEAWCPGCEYFKAKRTPRKRERTDYW